MCKGRAFNGMTFKSAQTLTPPFLLIQYRIGSLIKRKYYPPSGEIAFGVIFRGEEGESIGMGNPEEYARKGLTLFNLLIQYSGVIDLAHRSC